MPISSPSLPAARRSPLLRLLGVGFGLAVVVGGTAGTGILLTPAAIAAQLGAPGWVMAGWLIGGVYAFLGALSVAELGAMLPQAGGWYGYAERAFGRYVGFTVGWGDWISSCVTAALVALMAGDYAGQLVPAWAGHPRALALALLGLFGLVQWRGLRDASRAQEITALLMGLALVAIIAGSFWLPTATPATTAPTTGLTFSAVVIALQSVIFAYDGWYAAIYFAEEDHHPARDLPRSMLLGVVLVTATYLLLNAAFLRVLPFPEFAASDLPLSDVAQRLAGDWGRRGILVVALLALAGVLNSVLLMAARVLFSLGREGLIMSSLAEVAPGGTPRKALGVALLVSGALIATGTANNLLAVTSILFVGYYGVGFAAVLVLRRREPALPRPFRTWGYPLTPMVVLAGSVAFLAGNIWADPLNSLWAAGLVAVSYPAYRIVRRQLPEQQFS